MVVTVSSETREEKSALRGRLRIFFGYAAGVGKTYAMLEAAHEAKDRGQDIIVGYVERHTRPDTLALLNGLTQIPPREIPYRGMKLHEFDLDAALARKPQTVLLDELAHTNAPGSRNLKRYQDAEELLRAGINVYTTVNVQHLESLNDVVESITHITVKERIPDYIFDSADQVELVDIEPEGLIERLQAGKVYREGQAKQALENFFTRENLAALREIAMRRTADRLSRHAQGAENETVAKAGDQVLTCLSAAPSNAKVIRTAARMAEAFRSGFTALFVETPETKDLPEESQKRLRENMHLAEQLGARIVTVYGEDLAQQIVDYAEVSGITKIILGRTNHKPGILWKKKTLVDRITQLAGDLDIYIIPDIQPPYKRKLSRPNRADWSFHLLSMVYTILIVAAATGVSYIFFALGMREANIIICYLLGVILTSMATQGYLYGVVGSLLSVVSFNFFFTVPRFSLATVNPNHPITFVIFLVASFVTISLANRVKRQAHQSSQRAYYLSLLLGSSKRIQRSRDEKDIMHQAAQQVSTLLERPVLYTLVPSGGKPDFQVYPETDTDHFLRGMTSQEYAVADWVVKNDKPAGATTDTLSQTQNLYLPIHGSQGVLGVIGVPVKFYPDLSADPFKKNLMVSMLDESGLILERRLLQQEKQAVELETQREKLRSNLLRGISHDLRTPLTAISGNAAILMDQQIALEDEEKNKIYLSIYDDSMWLMDLTENLLSITKIENGTLQLNESPELISDIFQEALSHADRRLSEHEVSIDLSDELLMVRVDARLIMQVVNNIVNNAVKYTPQGSHICLSAHKAGDRVRVTIKDDGPGIPDTGKTHLFDMFYTADIGKSDSRRGLGLGLSLCKSIIEAHGGKLMVEDNNPHGAVFTFTLPLEEVSIPHE